MPVIIRVRRFRVWFYQADLDERPHVHVGKSGCEAKYWVAPISLAKSRGFASHELNEIERLLAEYRTQILTAWRTEKQKRDHGES